MISNFEPRLDTNRGFYANKYPKLSLRADNGGVAISDFFQRGSCESERSA